VDGAVGDDFLYISFFFVSWLW